EIRRGGDPAARAGRGSRAARDAAHRIGERRAGERARRCAEILRMVAVVAPSQAATVALLADLEPAQVEALLAAYGARLERMAAGAPIAGSYWGETEAGLVGNTVFVRADTPAHSFLHELCHFVCMDETRRRALATDAGGDDAEECGVCYLQVLLAERLDGFGR